MTLEVAEDRILYRDIRSVKCGEIERFKLEYSPQRSTNSAEPQLPIPSNLWVKVRNNQLIALRAAYLAGPYVLYVDCKLDDYDQNQKCFVTADQPVFELQLLPGQSFYVELSCHTLQDSYKWTLDVMSQILFNNTIEVEFEVIIGTSKSILKDASFPEKTVKNSGLSGLFVPNSVLQVTTQDTLDLWNIPVPDPVKPIHLVILTHGLHSNVTADMLYLKEQIDKSASQDNIVVKGFFGNKGKTERGVKYLGSRVAEYVVDLVTKNELFNNGRVTKISFIGHSLGGLVQTFAIAYIHLNFPWFFEHIKPVNFVTIASPLLGVVNENPMYVKLALMAGVVGLTGQDLGLKYIENGDKPLLLLLPTGPTHQVLKRFVRRTLYANAVNDGVVPLRTSSLLFFDYEDLSQIVYASEEPEHHEEKPKAKGLALEKVLGAGKDGKYGFLPMLALLSYFLPQKQSEAANGEDENEQETNTKEDKYKMLPKSSFLDAAASLILPPLPSMKYITDPDSRENVILHDKVYTEDNLPKVPIQEIPSLQAEEGTDKIEKKPSSSHESYTSLGIRKKLLESIDHDTDRLEESIAMEYHKNMSWRKVIVKLKPDAHNNIIVRRRFANAYGWPIIDHIVENHFPEHDLEGDEGLEQAGSLGQMASTDSLDGKVGLSKIISRDLIAQQNNKIDKEQGEEDSVHDNAELTKWIKESNVDAESFFAVGVTGMLGDVSEMVGNFKDHCYKYGVANTMSNYSELLKNRKDASYAPSSVAEPTDNFDRNMEGKVMGGFL